MGTAHLEGMLLIGAPGKRRARSTDFHGSLNMP
jgi:hypothetical protein